MFFSSSPSSSPGSLPPPPPSSLPLGPSSFVFLPLIQNPFIPDYEIVNTGSPVPDLFDYVPWANGAFSLSNTGDELLLLDFFDNIVDAVARGDFPWLEFNPPAGNPDQGSTLERFPAYLDTNTVLDWREQPTPSHS